MERTGSFIQNRKWAVALTTLGILSVLVLTGLVSGPLVRFASRPEQFRQWVESHGIWGTLAYMGMVFLQVVIALIPGEPFEIAAGYAFGAWKGTLLYLIAATLGSMTVFFLVRRFGRPLAEFYFPGEKLRSLRFLSTNPRRELLFLLIFLLPGTPKDLMCYFAGLTDLRPGVWLVICSLGRIPAAITSTLGGDALGDRNYGASIATFVVTLAISALGLWLFRRICNTKNKEDAS